MSASDKKKLRKEQSAAAMTEKQRAQQAEAKKLKVYTISFVSVILVLVCVFLGVLGVRAVNNSGVIQKNTIAATIAGEEINSVILNYYFNDTISEYYNDVYTQYEDQTNTYLALIGLDTSKPLNEQLQDKEKGTTWADYFVNAAIEEAKNDYVLYNLAMNQEKPFKLSDEDQTSLDNTLNNLGTYAMLYGYKNANQYLRNMYGFGSTEENYKEYLTRTKIADAFYNDHMDSLKYDEKAIEEYEKDKKENYNSYTYYHAYLSYSDFLQGGTKSEDGKTTTYSDAEKDAARAALKAAAEEMATATSLDDLKEKGKAVKVNDKSEVVVNEYKNDLHTDISNKDLSKWLASADRKEGDIAAIAVTAEVEGEDGKKTTVTNGYYVVYFQSMRDNTDPMANVRHLLVKFEGGTKGDDGKTVYSEAEKNKAKTEAEGYLKTWKEGEKADEDSFIELIKKHSDDSSASTGGLFEDIHPDSNYVPNFLAWAIDDSRKPGDTGVIETEYGYHVMYYSSDDELSYRDLMITEELRANDQNEWYEGLMKDVATSVGDTSKMNLDITLS